MQVDVDTSLAFGTAKNVQIGSSPGGTGVPSPNTTLNTRSTAQHSYHHLRFPHGKLEIGS